MEKLLLLDGHSILSRAYYGLPRLTTHDGVHTGAVYGFVNIMLRFLDDEKPDYIAAAFDPGRGSLRRVQIYPEYKGTRKPMDEELLMQVPLIMEMLTAMRIPVFMLEGYEADDILGTLACKAASEGMETIIVSGDRDMLQLVGDGISVSIPKTSKGRTEIFRYKTEEVLRDYRVTPEQFVDLKALMGDSSDNIPGLPGVGEKTAVDLMVSFGSLENIKAHEDELLPKRARTAVKEHFDLALLSRSLARIDTNVPVTADLRAGRARDIYTPEALSLMRELELKSLAARFGAHVNSDSGVTGSAAADFLPEVKIVTDIFLAGVVLKDFVTAELTGFRFYADGEGRAVLSLALSKDRVYVLLSGAGLTEEKLACEFSRSLEMRAGSHRRSLTLGLKEQLKFLDPESQEGVWDLEIAHYVLDPNNSSHDYDAISKDLLGVVLENRAELTGRRNILSALFPETDTQMELFSVPETPPEQDRAGYERAVRCAALSAFVPFMAAGEAEKRLLAQGTFDLLRDVEMPLVFALDRMEKAGIRADRAALRTYETKLQKEIDELTRLIYETAGEEFNINSPQQLGTILFDKLGVKGARKTKKGYSTAADVLEKIRDEHEIVPMILRYRTLTKLCSTYARGLADYIGPDGRIHGTFNQTTAATGRISSTEPNLQNIPVRTAEGREFRKVFIPAEGSLFVDADYSQVELRILASLSGDEALIAAYEDAVDIHSLTASQVFHVPLSEVTDAMRRSAKAVNFGIVYGISAFGLGEDLSVGRKEAAEYIERYFESYPGVKEYLDNCVKEAKEKGFVRTLFGRVRPVPELHSSNYAQRSFGERIAMNSPIQGTAADIMKIAMIRTDEALRGMKSRIVLQVHDELLVETAPEELEEVMSIVRECMENAAQLRVRLSVDVRMGESWYECH